MIKYNFMNDDKNYDKFVVDNSATMGEGRYEDAVCAKTGQEKYAKRGGYKSIYEDPTRDTEDDIKADKRSAEPCGVYGEYEESSDESQDGKY